MSCSGMLPTLLVNMMMDEVFLCCVFFLLFQPIFGTTFWRSIADNGVASPIKKFRRCGTVKLHTVEGAAVAVTV